MSRNDEQPDPLGTEQDSTERSGDSITRPVLAGVTALLTVAVAVGLIVAGGAVVLTRMLGLGAEDGATASSGSSRTLYMPEISETETEAATEQPTESAPTGPSESPSATPGAEIRLTANPSDARANTQINLTVSYPAGPDAILQVQRKSTAGWEDFPVSPINMSGRAEASTWIVSSLTGTFSYRVRDTDTGKSSKPVKITLR